MQFTAYLKKSVYDVAWLRQQKNQSKKAWGYFLVFLLIMMAIATVPLLIGLPAVVGEVRTKVKEIPDFQATLKDGKLVVTGLAQPAVFKSDGNFVIVIDTAPTSSIMLKSFLEHAGQSGILVVSDRMELVDGSTGQQKIQYWKGVPDFALNKVDLLEKTEKYLSPGWLAVFVILFSILAYIATVAAQLLSIFFVALIVLVVAKVRRQAWQFKELFTVGLFAITLPTIIAAIFTLLGFGTSLVQFLALLAFMLAVVFTKEERTINLE